MPAVELNGLYNHVRSRQLEGTFPGDPQLGIWPITSMRVGFGWGHVTTHDWPDQITSEEQWPPSEPPGLDAAAKKYRIGYYQRLRTLDDCKHALVALHPPLASVEITEQWFDAQNGIIPDPHPADRIIGCHAFMLSEYNDAAKLIRFPNSWGVEWGDSGFGTISYEYFRQRSIETWIQYSGFGTRAMAEHVAMEQGVELAGRFELMWGIRDVVRYGVLHGVEFYDYTNDERMAWAFAAQRGEFLDIEELYVRPTYRRAGYGSRLCKTLLEMSAYYRLIPRFWVSFADCGEENRAGLESALRILGLSLRNTDERWAAYVALPGVASRPLRSIQIPPRPAVKRGLRIAASAFVASAMGLGSGSDLSPERVQKLDSARAASPTALGSETDLAPGDAQARAEEVPKLSMQQGQHIEFLKRVSTVGNPPPITQQTAQLAEIAWQQIWKASHYKIPIPAACTGPNGEMFYSWDSGQHHLELEIMAGRPAEFFYRDRNSEQYWGDDYEVGGRLPDEVVEKLKLFI